MPQETPPAGRALRLASLGLLLGLLLPPAADGQRRRLADQTVAETTEVLAVEVPVQVLRDGQPVRGLTQADFEIVEGRKKQPLIGFDVVDLSTVDGGRFWGEGDAKSIPLAARRHFLLLFDLSFSDPTAIVRARQGAKDLVLKSLHPADMAGVVTFSESRGVQLVLNFTSDRRQMLEAIDGLGMPDPLDVPNTDPLRMTIDTFVSRLDQLADTGGGNLLADTGAGLADRLEMQLAALQDTQRMAAVSVREQKQSQIQGYMDAMSQVGQMLRQSKGTKHVVLLSEGFDSTVLMGNAIQDQERIQQLAEAAESGRYWEIDSNERYGSTAALFGLTQVIEEFRRSGAAIQAVDIGGLRATDLSGSSARESAVRQDGLFVLANDTGGELFRNYNDMGVAMGELLDRTSVTYLLTFQPRDLLADGTFHRIEVKLGKKHKGARLVHRPGYYAPIPYMAADPTERRLRTARMIFENTQGGAFDLAVVAAPAAHQGERTWTPIVVDVEGAGLLRGAQPPMLPVEIYAYAFRPDGTVADFFAQAMGLDLRETQLTLASTGLRFLGNLDLEPGSYRLRVLVRNSRTGSSAVSSGQIVVPDLLGDDPFVSTPLVLEADDAWLQAREQGDAGRPFDVFAVAGDRVPAARAALVSGQPARVQLLVHGLDLNGLRLRAWATETAEAPGNLDAFAAGDQLEAEIVGQQGGLPGNASQLLLEIPAGQLEARDQRLVVALEDGRGRRVHSSVAVLVR